MSMSPHVANLRAKVGHDLIVLPSATAVIRDDVGRILLARHADRDLWVAPGGAVDPGETPADAAVRETWEEVGLLVEPVRVLGVFGGPGFEVRYGNGDRTAYVMIAFECRVLAGTPRPDGEETQDVGWFTKEEASALPAPAWVRDVFEPPSRTGFETAPPALFQPPSWRPDRGSVENDSPGSEAS